MANHSFSHRFALLSVVIVTLITAACGLTASPTPTPTPPPTTPATATARPTVTPTPTNTPLPSPTPPPTTNVEEPVSVAGPIRASCGPAETAATSIEIRPNWQAGDTRIIQITTNREQSQARTQLRQTTASTTVTLTVLEASEAGYVLEWRSSSPQVDGLRAIQNGDLDELIRLVNQLPIEYETDGNGLFVAVRNPDELLILADQLVDQVTEELIDEGGSRAEVIEVMKLVRDMLLAQGQILPLVTRDIQIYHALYGLSLDPNNATWLQDELSNPLDGPAIPSLTQLNVVHANAEAHCAIIGVSRKIDEEKARDVIEQTLEQAAQATAEEGAEGNNSTPNFQFARFTVDETNLVEVDTAGGWMKGILFRRDVGLEQEEWVESKVFVDVSD